jgi:hypothetical protein
MRLSHLRDLETAVELIRREMRVSIVHSLTGISPKALRALHREIHGRGAVAGQIPSTGGILSTRIMHATASVFATLYHSTGGSGVFEQLDLKAMLTAYDLYLELCQDLPALTPNACPISINQAWAITRDIRTGAAYFHRCQRCRILYLLAEESRLPPACPICSLRKREPK